MNKANSTTVSDHLALLLIRHIMLIRRCYTCAWQYNRRFLIIHTKTRVPHLSHLRDATLLHADDELCEWREAERFAPARNPHRHCGLRAHTHTHTHVCIHTLWVKEANMCYACRACCFLHPNDRNPRPTAIKRKDVTRANERKGTISLTFTSALHSSPFH